MKQELIELKKRLLEVDYQFLKNSPYPTINSRHEKIKSVITEFGQEQGYISIPEVNPSDESRKKIDVVWFSKDSHEPEFGFEVDGGYAPHSVEKLVEMKTNHIGFQPVIITKSSTASKQHEAHEKLKDEIVFHMPVRLDKHL